MKHTPIIEATKAYVRDTLSEDCTGHDWWHIYRVHRVACHIAIQEKADLFVVELAALLHDIADWKFNKGNETIGTKIAETWLLELGVNKTIIEHVCNIITNISFKGAYVKTKMETLEGKIVQDADRIDAIGAIGIARAFAYGGHVSRPMFDPEISPKLHHSFEAYKQNKGSTINHFYEKLLLLKGQMNTSSGKQIAENKHKFMKNYLKQFQTEWGGQFL